LPEAGAEDGLRTTIAGVAAVAADVRVVADKDKLTERNRRPGSQGSGLLLFPECIPEPCSFLERGVRGVR
jgi:hypothetical protein